MNEQLVCTEDHVYRVGTRRVPGANEVMRALGISDPYDSAYSDWYMARGSAIHKAIEFHLTGRGVNEATLDPQVAPFYRGALRFIEEAGIDGAIGEIERAGFQPTYGYAGKPDYRGLAFRTPAVVDWKSGSLDDSVGLVLALYDLLPDRFGNVSTTPRRRMAVVLDERGGYRKRDYDDRRDYARALAAVDLYRAYHLRRLS